MAAAVVFGSGCSTFNAPPAAEQEDSRNSRNTVLDGWLEQLEHEDPAQRDNAAEALRQQGRRAVPGLIDRFESDDYDLRVLASEIVASIGTEALPDLRRELRENETPKGWRRHQTTLETIQRMGPSAASLSGDLLALIRRNPNEQVTRRVADAWVAMGAAALPEVTRALADDDSSVSDVGYQASWRLGPPAVRPLLEAVTRGETEAHRQQATAALTAMLGHSSRDEGGLLLHGQQGHYKEYVSIDGRAVAEQIVTTLCPRPHAHESHPAAHQLLRSYGTPSLVCTQPEQRVAVAWSLRSDEDAPGPDRLLDLLEHDPDPVIRGRAASALGTWARSAPRGDDTEAVMQALLAALADVDPVATEATSALTAFHTELPSSGVRAVLTHHLRYGTRTKIFFIPPNVLGQLGRPGFDVLLALADDDTLPSKERALAVRWIARADLIDMVGPDPGPPTTPPIVGWNARLERLEAQRDAVLERADASNIAEIRAEGLAGLVHRNLVRGTLPALAPRIRERMDDGDARVRRAAVDALLRFLPPRRSEIIRGSTPEATVTKPAPARPFSRKGCAQHGATPGPDAAESERASWATCRLIELQQDPDASVAEHAEQTLHRAGVELHP